MYYVDLYRLVLIWKICDMFAAMDDRQETSLIEIMVCCVKQSATGEYPVGRGPTRKVSKHLLVISDIIVEELNRRT